MDLWKLFRSDFAIVGAVRKPSSLRLTSLNMDTFLVNRASF